jgi:hypothetical protein
MRGHVNLIPKADVRAVRSRQSPSPQASAPTEAFSLSLRGVGGGYGSPDVRALAPGPRNATIIGFNVRPP